jgi:hypothetical protein
MHWGEIKIEIWSHKTGGHYMQVFNWYEMYCEGKLKLKSHNTSYCLIEVVTKEGLTIYVFSGTTAY